jgi:deazaflavin-dependent oxidoreductase (nitroreductase family)
VDADSTSSSKEPFAARLHFVPRLVNLVQRPLVRLRRPWLERSPHWVLLGTRGRRTGLPRETLLPCLRRGTVVVVISTYGHRADWLRNLRRDPVVSFTAGGGRCMGRAEIVEDLAAKAELVRGYRVFLPFPSGLTNALLGPLAGPLLPRWVRTRPVVVLRPL